MENSTGKEKVEVMIAYGRISAESSNEDSYKSFFDAISESKEKGFNDCLVKAYVGLTYTLMPRAQYDSAYYFINEAINISKKYGLNDLLGNAYSTLGFYYYVIDDFKQSYQAYYIADSILSANPENEYLCQNYLKFSKLLYDLNEFESALSYLNNGIDVAERNGFYNLQIDMINFIAFILMIDKNYAKSEEYLNKSIELCQHQNYFFGLAETYENFGNYHTDYTKDYENAKSYYIKAYELYTSIGFKTYAATACTKISHILMLENKYTDAVSYAERALLLREETGVKDLIGSSMINIGNIYFSSKNYNKALDFVTRGLKTVQRIDMKTNGYKKLYDIKFNLKDYKGALEAYRTYTAYLDSISLRESFKSISQIEIKYNLERQLYEIDKMEYELQTNKLTYTIIFSVGLLFATFISTIAFLSKRKTNLKLKEININNEKIIEDRTAELKSEISIRKKTEIDLQKALEKEKYLGELKSRFVSMVSHEFRTPLTGIETSADLLKMNIEKTGDSAKHKKYINRIYNELNRLTTLLDDILLFGRTDSGKIKFSPIETDLISLINNLIDYLKRNNRNFISPEKIHIKGNRQNIFCDQNMMEIIFTNLFINANKYSPKNTKWNIDIKYSDDYTEISISDNGIGIPEEEIPFLFESFFRGSNTTGIPGTGIGLVTVKQMVDEHKGTITVKNNPDKGVTFTMRMPCK